MKASGTGTAWGPYLLVVAGAGAGLGAVVFGAPPWAGGVIVGGAFILGSAIRLIVSDERAGPLAIRSRKADVVILATLGAALVLGSLSLLLRLHNT
ncbi:DUF3017 domain-containing protein [Planotetraspora sp. GP83]|uniref:DUF3017 domain-containing protein n=1 Tax=Planotetraspora sp. GP83 TaxID=3156264 RepID=UPI003516D988